MRDGGVSARDLGLPSRCRASASLRPTRRWGSASADAAPVLPAEVAMSAAVDPESGAPASGAGAPIEFVSADWSTGVSLLLETRYLASASPSARNLSSDGPDDT